MADETPRSSTGKVESTETTEEQHQQVKDNVDLDDGTKHYVASLVEKIRTEGRTTVVNLNPTIQRLTIFVDDGSQSSRVKPKCVAIGPFHRAQPELARTEILKLRCLYYLTRVFPDLESSISDCFRGLKGLELKAREAYSESIDHMDSNEFVEMLLLDSCFIILLFAAELHVAAEQDFLPDQPIPDDGEEEDSTIMFARILEQMRVQISENQHNPIRDVDRITKRQMDVDIVLLENQIPYFAVEHVWDWLKNNGRVKRSRDLTHYLVGFLDPCKTEGRRGVTADPYHLLHILHYVILPRLDDYDENNHSFWIPSATELEKAGIELRRYDPPEFYMGIRFNNGVLEIPETLLNHSNRIYFQNLVDFEQSIARVACHVTAFVRFMGCLMCKEEDVRLLYDKGIIKKDLPSDTDAQRFFNEIFSNCKSITHMNYLQNVFLEINTYFEAHRGQNQQELEPVRVRRNPWVITAVLAAAILLILTFLQTFYMMFWFYHPKS